VLINEKSVRCRPYAKNATFQYVRRNDKLRWYEWTAIDRPEHGEVASPALRNEECDVAIGCQTQIEGAVDIKPLAAALCFNERGSSPNNDSQQGADDRDRQPPHRPHDSGSVGSQRGGMQGRAVLSAR